MYAFHDVKHLEEQASYHIKLNQIQYLSKAHLLIIETPQSFLQKSTPVYTAPGVEKIRSLNQLNKLTLARST